MKDIVQNNDPVLHTTAEVVALPDIPSKRIQTILRDMKEALDAKEHGVALAAPQIGVPLRIFIVSRKAFSDEDTERESLVYINPELIRSSKKMGIMEEACLSVTGLYGKVRRATHVTVRAYDERGEIFTRGTGGLLAQIFQHEIDHLNGILYTDKAIETHELENE